MGPDLTKLSDDELFNRLGQIMSRIAYAQASPYGGNLLRQLLAMEEEVNFVINDRMQRLMMEQKIASQPATVDVDGPQEKKKVEDTNSRAKSKSDIINRLRRTAAPTNLKDA